MPAAGAALVALLLISLALREPRAVTPLLVTIALVAAGLLVWIDWRLRSSTSAASAGAGEGAGSELPVLYDLARCSARSLNLDEVMGLMAGGIATLVHHECLVIYLYDAERHLLAARHVRGPHSQRLGHLAIPLGARVSGRAAEQRKPVRALAPDAAADGTSPRETAVTRTSAPDDGQRSDFEELMHDGDLQPLGASLAAPLFDRDNLLGVLTLYDRRERPYDDDDLRLVGQVAGHVAAAVRNSLEHAAGHGGAFIDPLTRLPNADYLIGSFEEEVARAQRQKEPLSIIELDVSNFDEVNTRFGHEAGDRILREMARLIRAQLRGRDTCVRYAGDEFVVIVPGVGRQGTDRLQKRIKEEIESHKFRVQGGKHVRLSVILGSASFPQDGKTFDALLAVADARLYDLKSAREEGAADRTGYQKFTGRRNVPVN